MANLFNEPKRFANNMVNSSVLLGTVKEALLCYSDNEWFGAQLLPCVCVCDQGNRMIDDIR